MHQGVNTMEILLNAGKELATQLAMKVAEDPEAALEFAGDAACLALDIAGDAVELVGDIAADSIDFAGDCVCGILDGIGSLFD